MNPVSIEATRPVSREQAYHVTGRGAERISGGNVRRRPMDVLHLTGSSAVDDRTMYTRAGILGQNKEPSRLTEEEEEMVRELQVRDREVRQHEQTHFAMLGRYARGGPTYVYQVGPDGKSYAVGGSVAVDVGKESTPESTALKARILRMAATGVHNTSAADMSVAAQAGRMEAEAQADSAEE